MALPPRQKFGDALRAAGVDCKNPRGWWGGISNDGLPVVTTWLDASDGPNRFWIWQPATNHGGLLDEWAVGNIRVGVVVKLVVLSQYGDVPLHHEGRRVAGARLMPGHWRVVEMRMSPTGWPGAIVEPVEEATGQKLHAA